MVHCGHLARTTSLVERHSDMVNISVAELIAFAKNRHAIREIVSRHGSLQEEKKIQDGFTKVSMSSFPYLLLQRQRDRLKSLKQQLLLGA